MNIPLVDCDMNLLPIHFLVDPSLRHGNEFRDPSQEEKLFILKKYLEVNLIGERNDLLIDLGNGSTTSGSNPSKYDISFLFAGLKNECMYIKSSTHC